MELIKTGSLTSAQRAAAILSANGIYNRRRRSSGREGCAYGIEVSGADYARAIRLLNQAGIKVR